MDPFNSYDAVPYWGNPYRESHPDQLAAMARLFGLTPPDVDHSRVLELGCSSGANLIPMAVTIPGATFLGVDLSLRQIDEGQKMIAALGLKNVELQHASIDTISDAHGHFDYIICHGVYSWVPRNIQDHILRICNKNLSPQGVAYVSYNTYPGWFMRGMVRRMMKFHARQFNDPRIQLEQARALLDFLFTASSGVDPAYHTLLSRELNILKQCDDSYIYHEHLEDDNEPLFFHEFIKRAEVEGLRYLAEPHLSEMVPVNVPSEIANVLGQVGPDIVEFEQYLDFLKNRTFRRTLLCHADQIPDRQIGPARLAEFRVASTLKRSGEGSDLYDTAAWEFTTGSDTVAVTSPVHKAALTVLEQIWPDSMICTDLVMAVQLLLDSVTDGKESIRTDRIVIGEFVLQMYLRQFFEISTSTPRFQSVVPERPNASPYARLQAKAGSIVTNLKHQRVQLGALDHELLCYLDGERTHQELNTLLNTAIVTGRLTIQNDSGPIPTDERTIALTTELLKHGLSNLARQALLMP